VKKFPLVLLMFAIGLPITAVGFAYQMGKNAFMTGRLLFESFRKWVFGIQ
jgi:hypothetical protein